MDVLKRLDFVFNLHEGFPSHCLKPKQVQCFKALLKGRDVVAVLPTGYGKSLIFQLLPDVIPQKSTRNIVIVVCPLSSIIEDQVQFLNSVGISAMSLHCNNSSTSSYESLFAEMKTHEEINISKIGARRGYKSTLRSSRGNTFRARQKFIKVNCVLR
ncbi:ATP-dependent DNA helicase Q1-like [Hydractinia symbiolongicarpus]|uniref:ATP-dependent DNA helicase Q1-like n=1 Tax=Hydractinia symbiolongicarpus TaxID=13093 RepID=UPI00254D9A95|nr:ATP-dependent DNA helicase Q1-like [Hydractinia symbiolongicarpus]